MEEILRKLVAFRTITGDETATHQALDYIADFVRKRGMSVERFDSNGFESLVATVIPGNKTPKVMLAAHVDVLPAADEQFTLQKSGGKLFGRGVLDMLCAIAAYLQIIGDLAGKLQHYDFGLMITSDEEFGGQDGVAKLLEAGYQPQVCVLPDGGDNWQIQVHAKGILLLKVRTVGLAAHGSRPWLGENAIWPLVDCLREIQALFAEAGPATSTLNLGKIRGGTAANQAADSAEALLDIRLMKQAERAPLLKKLRAICARHGAELTVETEGPVAEFSLNEPLIAPFAKLITEVTGVAIEGSRTFGTSDARYFVPLGIPCISFYPVGGDHHGPKEWLDEQAFYQMKTIIAKYLEKVARVI